MAKKLMVLCLFLCAGAWAQRAPLESPLLDHLAGHWVLQGVIAGKPATHDVTAEWVANHQYLRLHEVSRDTTPDGKPAYDAFIHIGWNEKKKSYVIIWLDNFWTIDPASIGTGSAKANEILFLWRDPDGSVSFSNNFVYDPQTDSWEWAMANVVKGTEKPFGRVKLTRAKGL